MLLSADDRLSRARVVLERRGRTAAELLNPVIADSWSRCLAAGLDPMCAPALEMADSAALRAARERCELVRRLALAEIETLYQQIAGTNFMVAFAAADGMLLDTIADASFSATAHAASIRPGALWAESRFGTNALGTAAASQRPVMVHGGEHFFARFGALTCTAAPVFDADGQLCGVLDASSDCRSRQRHTGALVAMAATQIENGLLREQYGNALLLAFHSRAEFLHTLNAGLLALDADGTLLAANAQARFLLQGLPAMRGRHFAELFRSPLGAVLGGATDRVRLEDRVGSIYAGQLQTPPRRRVPLAVQPAVTPPPPPPCGPAPGFVAADPGVAAALRAAEAAATRRLPVLICGETGTGKEQMARHIHAASRRAGSFIGVNCAALPESLAEAELFGHAEGAFTGARRGGAKGLAVEADGGTLFLDEIGEMKPALQAILLRLLDDWTVRPVGGGRARVVDVQLVAASNVDLPAAVAAGRFRADLYWRLNTVEVALPPLRMRSDFAAIVHHVMAGVAPRGRITPDALAALARRDWPGNIRELRSVLTRLTLLAPDGIIDAAALPLVAPPAVAAPAVAPPAVSPPAVSPPAVSPLADPQPAASPQTAGPPSGLRAQQRNRIAAAYRASGGNVSATARELGVSRNTIYRALTAPP